MPRCLLPLLTEPVGVSSSASRPLQRARVGTQVHPPASAAKRLERSRPEDRLRRDTRSLRRPIVPCEPRARPQAVRCQHQQSSQGVLVSCTRRRTAEARSSPTACKVNQIARRSDSLTDSLVRRIRRRRAHAYSEVTYSRHRRGTGLGRIRIRPSDGEGRRFTTRENR